MSSAIRVRPEAHTRCYITNNTIIGAAEGFDDGPPIIEITPTEVNIRDAFLISKRAGVAPYIGALVGWKQSRWSRLWQSLARFALRRVR